MTATNAHLNDVIQIEVLVPVEISVQERPAFEQAMVDFLFGADRVRPELREALAAEGVDFNHLAALSEYSLIGVCPYPGALEFIPSYRVVEACKGRGIDLTSGGSVQVEFSYDAFVNKPSPSDELLINLKLPESLASVASESSEFAADIIEALFGDCQLAEPARDYLRAHGVELKELAARNVDRLGGAGVPFTSRVTPQVHRYLMEKGFNVNQIGRFGVNAVDGVSPLSGGAGGVSWTKATCC
jgi:hypothetical protein